MKKLTVSVKLLKQMHTKENWFLFFCLTVYITSHRHVI